MNDEEEKELDKGNSISLILRDYVRFWKKKGPERDVVFLRMLNGQYWVGGF